ncbi:hypothetical protein DICVIV_11312 [Dictyocaulus viviparus]|uniref:Trypsin Inhibitor like cysteine rich domain protein n=1 Tax=Dictyocaulus viviparus TaxID=29172 RepID=A0A0D8XDK4_DICVI|nr:hypothetical protein DICVIV_11312 [Dictyocaulus viviparus]
MIFRVIILVITSQILISYCNDEAYDDITIPVTETDIPHQCKTNEVWMECGTCENKCGEPKVQCPRVCKPPQCQCLTHKGYRRDKNGNCVKCE